MLGHWGSRALAPALSGLVAELEPCCPRAAMLCQGQGLLSPPLSCTCP